MNGSLLLAVGLLLLTPTAAGLAALPPEPPVQGAPGLAFVTFRVPVRTEAGTVTVTPIGDPVGDAGLAPPGGPPRDRQPLAADPVLPVPDDGNATWRGYEDVHHVVLRLQAPNVDGVVTRAVVLAADGTRLRVPLRFDVTPRLPGAEVRGDHVTVDAPHARTLDGVHLEGPDRSWAAAPVDEGFRVPIERLPTGVPLVPTLTLRNGTTVAGDPVTVPELPGDPADGDAAQGPERNGSQEGPRNRSRGPDGPNPDPEPDPRGEQDPGPPAPARVDDGDRLLPAAPAALAALAAAARATL